MINLVGMRACIFGLPGSGKTTLAKHLLKQYPKHFIYDYHGEYKDCSEAQHCKHYKPMSIAVEEFNKVIDFAMLQDVDLIAIDEANIFCPNRIPLCDAMRKLNDTNRHLRNEKGIGFICIARRPVQLHTDLVELAHYLFIFGLKGKNDRQYLNSLVEGLGDAVAQLCPFHFILVYPDRHYDICEPIQP